MNRAIPFWKLCCLPVFLLVQGQISFGQCATIFKPLSERVSESAIIVEASVLKQEAFYGDAYGLIYTNNLLEIYKVFKGQVTSQFIEVVTMGGVLSDQALVVHPSLELNSGQVGIFMLKVYEGNKIDASKSQILRPVADTYSLIKFDPSLQKASDGGKKTFFNRQSLYNELESLTGLKPKSIKALPLPPEKNMMPSITSFTPTTADGGKSETITITGTSFGAVAGTVFFDDADDGPSGNFTSTIAWHIVSWTDTEIVVRVPATAGTGSILVRDNSAVLSAPSTQTLTVNYAQTNIIDAGTVYEPELIDEGADGDGGYRFNYSTSASNNGVDITSISAATDALERAADSWHTGASTPFFLGTDCGTSTSQLPNNSTGTPVDDGTNLISFESDIWDLDTEHSTSTLAVLYSMYGICNSSNWEAVDLDLIIRQDGNGVTWEYGPATPSGGETDFETVVLHELGHATQLKHTNNSGAVMFATIAPGFSNRSLAAAQEIAGGSYVITHSVTYNPPVETCSADFMSSRDATTYSSSNECSALLPVELVYFESSKKENGIQLYWQTSSETDNAFFTLERSSNSRDFGAIATLEGARNSYNPTDYHFLDQTPHFGLNYYRLSQTDFNGDKEYLGVVVESFEVRDLDWAPVQNPVSSDQMVLEIRSPEAHQFYFSIFDLKGALLKSGSQKVQAGMNRLDLDISKVPNGVFILKTQINQKFKSYRMVKI